MMVLSRGLSALRDEKHWCSTLDQWMDGAGVRAHIAVKRLLYHLYMFTWMNSPPSMVIEIRYSFKAFIDSTSAISNAVSIRDLIPKRQYPNNADCMTIIKDATRVISRMCLEHVKSHQDTKTNFE